MALGLLNLCLYSCVCRDVDYIPNEVVHIHSSDRTCTQSVFTSAVLFTQYESQSEHNMNLLTVQPQVSDATLMS